MSLLNTLKRQAANPKTQRTVSNLVRSQMSKRAGQSGRGKQQPSGGLLSSLLRSQQKPPTRSSRFGRR